MDHPELHRPLKGRRAALLIAAAALALATIFFAAEAVGVWRDASLALQRWQTELNRGLATAVRAVRDGGLLASGGLIGLSFVYGIVHAVGPGHGKAVIAAYTLADARRLRRGLALAWASAFAQAATAIILVLAIVHVAGAALRETQTAALWLERLAHAAVIGLGGAMIWTAVRRRHSAPHGNHHHHDHDCGCGHSHAPPAEGHRSLAVVLSIGLRPCSGALVVLGFSHVAGVIEAGILATLAMALGTALTVSALAMLAVGARQAALAAATDPRRVRMVETGLVLAGGFALITLGGLLLAGSLATSPAPFR